MILSLALSPSVDITYEVDALVIGAIARPSRVTRVAGGKALNMARVARELGADTGVIAALGGGAGRWIADRLAEESLPVIVVPLTRETRTCIAIVESGEVSTGESSDSSTDIYETATPFAPGEWDAFAAATLGSAVGSGDWVAVCGSLPSGVTVSNLVALLQQLRGRGVRIAVDASGEDLEMLALTTDLLKINLAEASGLLRRTPQSAVEAAQALHQIFRLRAVVTDSVRGAAACDAEGLTVLPPPMQRGRFPAGSGDAFLGGLLAGLDSGRAFADSLAAGSTAAMHNALIPGQGRLAIADRE